MVAGGVDVVACSLPEARALIDAGKVRPLAIMDPTPSALYPKLPTLKQELNTEWQIAAWRVIAAPKGVPADVQRTLVVALKKVYDSRDYREFMKGNLCRCGTYNHIVAAIQRAAGEMQKA